MAACFDIGGSFIRFGASDAKGGVSELGRFSTPLESFEKFVACLQEAIAKIGGHGGIVSISLAGFINPINGLATIVNVPALNGRSAERDLAAALGVQVRIANDADCFALAEATLGVGQDFRNVFAIILGTGVGGGIVIDRNILRGFGGVSGEWGHGQGIGPGLGLPVLACPCGLTGCLETLASARGIERIHAALTDENMDSVAITKGWSKGVAECSATIECWSELVARHLAPIVNVLGPEIVPVGGGLAADSALISALDRAVRRVVLARYTAPLLVPGRFITDGGLRGAAILAQPVTGG